MNSFREYDHAIQAAFGEMLGCPAQNEWLDGTAYWTVWLQQLDTGDVCGLDESCESGLTEWEHSWHASYDAMLSDTVQNLWFWSTTDWTMWSHVEHDTRTKCVPTIQFGSSVFEIEMVVDPPTPEQREQRILPNVRIVLTRLTDVGV